MSPTVRALWSAVSASREGLLASGLFVGCLLFALIWGASFSLWNLQLESEFDAKADVLARLKREGPSREGAVKKLDAKLVAVSAPTETIAASSLQQYILNKLEAVGESVHSIQSEPSRDERDGLQRLNAQLAFESSINSLQQFLFELETGTPFLFVDGLNIQPVTTAAGTGARPGDRLRISLAVSGYWAKSRTESTQ